MALSALAWTLAMALALWHFAILSHSKVDFPIADEWADFSRDRAFARPLTWTWAFATAHNHPMLGRRLLSWLLLNLNGRDFAVQAIVEFTVFGAATVGLLASIEILDVGAMKLLVYLGVYVTSVRKEATRRLPCEFGERNKVNGVSAEDLLEKLVRPYQPSAVLS